MTRSRKATAALIALALVLGALYLMGNTGGTTHKTFTEVPAGMEQAQLMSTTITKAQYCADHPKYCLKSTQHKVFHQPLTAPVVADDIRSGCWQMNASTSVDSWPVNLQGDYIPDVVGATTDFTFCSKDGVHVSSATWCTNVCSHHESWLWNFQWWQLLSRNISWNNEGMAEQVRFSVQMQWGKSVVGLDFHRSVTLTCTGFISTYHPSTGGGRWNCS